MERSYLSAWFLLHYYNFGFRIYDFGFSFQSAIDNPHSEIFYTVLEKIPAIL